MAENFARSPVHGAPNHIGRSGVCASGGVNAKLAAKGVGRIRGCPEDRSPVACTGRDMHLCVNASLERAAIAPKHLRRSFPVRIDMLHEREVARQDVGHPANGYLPRWVTVKMVEATNIWGDNVGRITRMVFLSARLRAQERQNGNQGQERKKFFGVVYHKKHRGQRQMSA